MTPAATTRADRPSGRSAEDGDSDPDSAFDGAETDAVGSDATEADADDPVGERRTRRWFGVGALSLAGLGVGVLTGSAGPLLASAFGLAFAGYGSLTSPPEIDLAVERTIDADSPEPGDSVTVTVTVTNESDRTMPDVRLIDGVPDRLGVAAGSPRHGAVLRPGASTTFSYAVRVERGTFQFDGVTVVARDFSGATERVATVGDRASLTCLPSLPTDPPAFPVREKTSQFTGRFPGDTGGPGVEFFATREYRSGDPLARVDWNRTARTGELTTVTFRVERTVRVALVVDARRSAHLAPTAHEPSAVERGVSAVATAYASLTRAGHAVGVSALAPVDCWLPPGRGDEHRMRARRLLATEPALSPDPPDEETNVYRTTQRLKGRLTADAQVVLFSPLHDDLVMDTVIRLDARGYAATVVSPDPTETGTAGQSYARVERRLRIADLRSRGIPVVDWSHDEDLGHALARTRRRWSA